MSERGSVRISTSRDTKHKKEEADELRRLPCAPIERRLQAEPCRMEVPCGPHAEFVVRVRPGCPLPLLVPKLFLPPIQRVLRRRPPELRFLRKRASQAAVHLFLEPRGAIRRPPLGVCSVKG